MPGDDSPALPVFPARSRQVSQAIESMTLESLAYKGLTETKETIPSWLGSLD